MRHMLTCVALTLLAACASEEEIRAAQAADDRAACIDLGFEPATDTFRLCELMQGNARRISNLTFRVNALDAQVTRSHTLRVPYDRP